MRTIIGGLVLALLMAFGCGPSTTIAQSWKAPQGSYAPLRRVATVMLARDVTIRRTAEDQMASRLRAAGVDAVPGYAVLSDQDYRDKQAGKAKLQALGFDGVVVMRLAGQETQTTVMPPTFTGYGWWGPGMWDPGYVQTETIVRVETAAYSLQSDQLVYSALSKTTDPNSIGSLLADVSSTVTKALTHQGVVAASRTPPPPAT